MKRQLLQRISMTSGLLIMSMMVVMHIKDVPFRLDASDGTTPSEFTSTGFNNPTLITDLVLSTTTGDAIKEVNMTPQSTFYLNATIQDFDGLTHQDIYFVVFHSDADEITAAMIDEKINQGVTPDSFVVRYLTPERSTYLSTAPIVLTQMTITTAVDNFMVKDGSTPVDSSGVNDHADYTSTVLFNASEEYSWSLVSGSSTIADTGPVGIVEAPIERDISIAFTPSKVAPQGTGNWHVAVVVYDRLQIEIPEPNTQELYIYSAMDNNYNMAFYGEIQLEPGQEIQFNDVVPGRNIWTDSSTGLLVRYIANGSFTRTATADVRWDESTLDLENEFSSAELHDPLSSENTTQYFYLQVYRDKGANYEATEILHNELFTTSSDVIAILPDSNTDYATASVQSLTTAVESNVVRTSELGQLTPFLFQIKLSPDFQNATYAGNMTIGITGG